NVYYNDVDHVMDNYTLRDPDPDGAMPMPMASNVAHRTSGGRAALGFGGDHWELTAGVDARNSRHARRSAMGRGQYLAQPWKVVESVWMSGVLAGKAVRSIARGGLLTTENVKHRSHKTTGRTEQTSSTAPDVSIWEDRTFMCYHTAHGQVGTANVWLSFPLVF